MSDAAWEQAEAEIIDLWSDLIDSGRLENIVQKFSHKYEGDRNLSVEDFHIVGQFMRYGATMVGQKYLEKLEQIRDLKNSTEE